MAIRRRVFDLGGRLHSGIGRIGKVPLGCEETELCIRYTAAFPDDRFVLARDAVVHHWVPAVAADLALLLDPVLGRGSLEGGGVVAGRPDSGLAAERRHVLTPCRRNSLGCAGDAADPRAAATRFALIVAGTSLPRRGSCGGASHS